MNPSDSENVDRPWTEPTVSSKATRIMGVALHSSCAVANVPRTTHTNTAPRSNLSISPPNTFYFQLEADFFNSPTSTVCI